MGDVHFQIIGRGRLNLEMLPADGFGKLIKVISDDLDARHAEKCARETAVDQPSKRYHGMDSRELCGDHSVE